MVKARTVISKLWIPALLALALALVAACGSSATSTPVPTATSAPAPTAMPTAMAPQPTAMAGETPEPTAMAQPTAVPPTSTPRPAPTRVTETTHVPEGIISFGVTETGVFEGHPRFMSSPRVQYSAVTFGESMVAIQPDLSPGPMLAASWDISPDGRYWTWTVRDDVEFHHKCGPNADQSCGNFTVHDVLWNYREWHEGSLNARAGIIGDFWVGNAGGSQTIIDDYTVEIDTGEAWLRERAFEFMRHLGGVSTSLASRQQTMELVEAEGGSIDDTSTDAYEAGARAASKNISATGPWEVESHEPDGSLWEFSAVTDHWRQTPYFAGLRLESIPEEAVRVAGYQTGNLDIIEMNFESLPTVEAVDGTVIVSWPNAGQAGLNIYGQTYGVDKEGNPYQHLDCNNAWVSCNEDPASQEWINAVKVKRAMAIAIDRQAIVDNIFSGFAQPLYMRDWMGHEAKADPRWVFEYDPAMARQLLEEAGHGDGFSITLTPAIRNAPGEVPACEAVAQYWREIGIEVQINLVPYATIRPELITRKYQGATCHTVSQRLTPAIGASNYVAKSTFSYGTEHPWMEAAITDLLAETNPELVAEKERNVYGWMYDNVMAFAIYAHDGIWPVGSRLDPEWRPVDFSEVRSPTGLEYIRHRE